LLNDNASDNDVPGRDDGDATSTWSGRRGPDVANGGDANDGDASGDMAASALAEPSYALPDSILD
jgi:hypothetical protein